MQVLLVFFRLHHEENAKNRAEEFQKICEEQGIPVPESTNPFVRLGLPTKAIADASYKLTEDEKQWESETKGMDDFKKTERIPDCMSGPGEF